MDFDEYYRDTHPTDDHDASYRWHPRHQIAVAVRVEVERAVLRAVATLPKPIEASRILDVGAGSGRWLRFFVEIGADPSNAHGIEVLAARVARASEMNPTIEMRLGDAGDGLPFADGDFDLVTQFVALSSVLDHDVRRRIASEMVRVTAIGGCILTYEIRRPQPGHIPDGVPEAELETLFPGVEWRYRELLHNIALPKLARWPLVAHLAEKAPAAFKTNYLRLGVRLF